MTISFQIRAGLMASIISLFTCDLNLNPFKLILCVIDILLILVLFVRAILPL